MGRLKGIIERRCDTCAHWNPDTPQQDQGTCALMREAGKDLCETEFRTTGNSKCSNWQYYGANLRIEGSPTRERAKSLSEQTIFGVIVGVLGNLAYDFGVKPALETRKAKGPAFVLNLRGIDLAAVVSVYNPNVSMLDRMSTDIVLTKDAVQFCNDLIRTAILTLDERSGFYSLTDDDDTLFYRMAVLHDDLLPVGRETLGDPSDTAFVATKSRSVRAQTILNALKHVEAVPLPIEESIVKAISLLFLRRGKVLDKVQMQIQLLFLLFLGAHGGFPRS